MNTPLNQTTPAGPRAGMHPMLIAAAIAIIVFCLAGTAAIMGWLPGSIGRSTSSDLTATDRAALASRLADDAAPGANGLSATGNSLAPAGDSQRLAMLERDRLAADHEREMAELERERERDRAMLAEREREPVREVREPVRVAKAEPAVCNSCGRVTSVETIKQRAQGSGLGAAGGAVLGGLLGNQIGDGSGRKIATVAGAVGGAVVGNQVEGNMKATITYRVHVRLDNGKQRSFNLQNLNGYSTGDRIRIVNGNLRHAN